MVEEKSNQHYIEQNLARHSMQRHRGRNVHVLSNSEWTGLCKFILENSIKILRLDLQRALNARIHSDLLRHLIGNTESIKVLEQRHDTMTKCNRRRGLYMEKSRRGVIIQVCIDKELNSVVLQRLTSHILKEKLMCQITSILHAQVTENDVALNQTEEYLSGLGQGSGIFFKSSQAILITAQAKPLAWTFLYLLLSYTMQPHPQVTHNFVILNQISVLTL